MFFVGFSCFKEFEISAAFMRFPWRSFINMQVFQYWLALEKENIKIKNSQYVGSIKNSSFLVIKSKVLIKKQLNLIIS